jgi:hypothetical protein
MLLPYPPKQKRKNQQNDHPDPEVTAFFCGVLGRLPRVRMWIRI